MKVRVAIIFLHLLVAGHCFSQSNEKHLQGTVTFTTSNSAYVKFDDTEKINIGDTLQIIRDSVLSPCLVVKNKSSTSCVCNILSGCMLKAGDHVFHPVLLQEIKKKTTKELPVEEVKKTTQAGNSQRSDSTENAQKINGRISVTGYSYLSSVRNNSHRAVYRALFNASHINNSKFSFDTYFNYNQNYFPKESTSSIKTGYFNFYELALRYDPSSDFSIIVGRKINSNATSIGAIDGLQAEKYFGKFYAGIITGFRPDIFNHNFNSDLFEFGSYAGIKTNNKNFQSQSNLGFIEQTNNKATDRRYAFFQHSSVINSNLNIFSSFEIDLYSKKNAFSGADPRLTNFFISSGYKISRKVNVNISYDSRRRILYYETFKTEIESLLEYDEARQGARVRVNVKPFKNTSIGLSYSKRFQSSGQNKSENFNGFFTINSIFNGLVSLYVNQNTSNYLQNSSISVRYSRSIIKKKLNGDFYYRIIQYKYLSSLSMNDVDRTYKQNFYGINLIYIICKNLLFSTLVELNSMESERNYRINANITKRF